MRYSAPNGVDATGDIDAPVTADHRPDLDTQASGPDLVLGAPLRFGIGYGLPSPAAVHIPDRRVCFWGGWGGSLIAVDTERRATISYVMNKMGTGLLGNERTCAYANAAFAALG